jgi:hypothetical protein
MKFRNQFSAPNSHHFGSGAEKNYDRREGSRFSPFSIGIFYTLFLGHESLKHFDIS